MVGAILSAWCPSLAHQQMITSPSSRSNHVKFSGQFTIHTGRLVFHILVLVMPRHAELQTSPAQNCWLSI
eukprot:8972851-Karenia_brevis.AAC.1